MEKTRVYELAKELNTTSKRLMEKLAEINIIVKNHMSLLGTEELEALYDHIGVIKHDAGKKTESEEKKAPAAAPLKVETKKDVKKDVKSAPRIIRTTEIFIDTKNGAKDVKEPYKPELQRGEMRGDFRGGYRGDQKRDFVRVAGNNSGLRPGFVRDTGFNYKKGSKFNAKTTTIKEPLKTEPRQEGKPEVRSEVKQEFKPVLNKEPGLVQQAETTRQGKDEARHESRHEGRHEVKRAFREEEKAPHGKAIDNQRNARTEHLQFDSRKGPGSRMQSESKRAPGTRPQFDNRRGVNERLRGGGLESRQGMKPGVEKLPGAYRAANKAFEIPKPELSDAQKEEMNTQRVELRREFQNKDIDKDTKREQKRDVPKGQAGDKNRRFKPQKVALSEKKGISEVLSEDYILNEFYGDDDIKKTKKLSRLKKEGKNEPEIKYIPPKAVLSLIRIPESITVKDLAESLKKTSTEVIKKFMGLGLMVTLNQEIDFDTASIIAEEFGVKAEKELIVNEEEILFDETEENLDELKPRPPVVVVMGHVDHGKTSLLDAIRETNVIDSEAGGITQHIGAYMVKINNRNITFLDTPGHEAFTAMRARGARVTDIAILVVAADDGVMPQTVEAINHAKAANVTIIVAINKTDKPGANPDKVKQELAEHGLVVEEWGGDVICVPVSAKKRVNIDHLLEMILLAADILELKTNPNKQAKGTVIEAKLDKDKGPIATVLVQRGTLAVGNSVVTGTTVGRIRAMIDDKGHNIKKAGPSTPAELLGLPEVPEAGEIFYAITDEKVAKQLAEKRKLKQREQTLKSSARVSLDDLFTQIKEGKVKDLNIIVKADVQGSVEAVQQSLEKLSNNEVRVKIIHGGVGAITESDVTLAEVSNAIIIGFNVRPGANVAEMAENAGVDMRLYRVIYNAIDDVQAAMKGMLEPSFKEVVQGHTEIRQIFKVSGVGTIGGCYVTDGKIIRNSEVRIVRNGIVIHEGKLASLKRFKDDAREVIQGFECGLSLERFNDIKEGDIIESFIMEEVAR